MFFSVCLGTVIQEHAQTHPIFCTLGQEMPHQQDCQKVWLLSMLNTLDKNVAVGVMEKICFVLFFGWKVFAFNLSKKYVYLLTNRLNPSFLKNKQTLHDSSDHIANPRNYKEEAETWEVFIFVLILA